ncbi:unnamed protein product, partial [Protopolystoma xenopodis]
MSHIIQLTLLNTGPSKQLVYSRFPRIPADICFIHFCLFQSRLSVVTLLFSTYSRPADFEPRLNRVRRELAHVEEKLHFLDIISINPDILCSGLDSGKAFQEILSSLDADISYLRQIASLLAAQNITDENDVLSDQLDDLLRQKVKLSKKASRIRSYYTRPLVLYVPKVVSTGTPLIKLCLFLTNTQKGPFEATLNQIYVLDTSSSLCQADFFWFSVSLPCGGWPKASLMWLAFRSFCLILGEAESRKPVTIHYAVPAPTAGIAAHPTHYGYHRGGLRLPGHHELPCFSQKHVTGEQCTLHHASSFIPQERTSRSFKLFDLGHKKAYNDLLSVCVASPRSPATSSSSPTVCAEGGGTPAGPVKIASTSCLETARGLVDQLRRLAGLKPKNELTTALKDTEQLLQKLAHVAQTMCPSSSTSVGPGGHSGRQSQLKQQLSPLHKQQPTVLQMGELSDHQLAELKLPSPCLYFLRARCLGVQ